MAGVSVSLVWKKWLMIWMMTEHDVNGVGMERFALATQLQR